MIKRRFYLIALIMALSASMATAHVYFSASADVHTRYIFRGFTPAGNQPALGLNFSAFFDNANVNISQWYVNSLSDISAYHELGTMVSYYHYFTDRLIGSGGLTMYLYPNLPESPLAGVEMNLSLADIEFVIPYFIETYFDFVLKSWYLKLTAGYTIDTFLPLNFSLSGGLNLLNYARYGNPVPAGLSDLTVQLSTYIALKRWQISPRFSFILTNTAIYPKPMLQASVSLAYSF